MKGLLKNVFKIIAVLLVVTIVFFLWASSSTMDEKKYQQLVTNQFKKPSNKDSIYSIVTYNIGYLSGMTNNLPVAKPKELFDKNLENVIEEIKAVNPDIIAFQEIDYGASRSYEINQQNEIAKLGYNYISQSVNWDETYVPFPYWPPTIHFGKVVSGQSIISKYLLKNDKRIVLERVKNNPFYRDAFYLERLAQVVTVELEGKEVILINVHLEAFDAQTRANQFEEVLTIFNKYKTTHPTILLGDFNSEARSEKAIIQKIFAMDNVGNAAFNVLNIENTFNSKDPFQRIDYIFYTEKTIEYISGKVLTQFGEASDHLPVEMKFKLK